MSILRSLSSNLEKEERERRMNVWEILLVIGVLAVLITAAYFLNDPDDDEW